MKIKRRIVGTSVLMLMLGSLVAFSGTGEVAAVDPIDQCVNQYAHSTDKGLHKGQVKKVSGTVTTVGGAGVAVKSATTTASGWTAEAKLKNGTARALTITSGADTSTPEVAGNAYAANGRSVLDDARAAGVGEGLIRKLCAEALENGTFQLMAVTGDSTIVDSICVHDHVDYVQWDGCVTRYRAVNDGDPSWNYGVDDAQAYGHETQGFPTWEDLLYGGVKNSYNTSRVDILKASPSSDITDVGECRTSGFSVGVQGFSVGESGQVCPSRWNITRTSTTTVPEYHKTRWEGESHNDREAVALSAFRYKPGYTTAYTITIDYKVG